MQHIAKGVLRRLNSTPVYNFWRIKSNVPGEEIPIKTEEHHHKPVEWKTDDCPETAYKNFKAIYPDGYKPYQLPPMTTQLFVALGLFVIAIETYEAKLERFGAHPASQHPL